ncbi:MAG: AraC family transcriptional regulator, partial [Chitinophagales bacterium]
MTKLFIKNMVCNRCKYVVATELQKLGYQVTANNLGEVEIKEDLNAEEMKEINNVLLPFGFELMDDEKIAYIFDFNTEEL